MSESQKSSIIGDGLKAIADTPFPYLFGIALLVALPSLASKWDGHLYSRQGCVQLQELQGRIYKVDTCTGNVEEVKSQQSSAASKDVKK